jgi:hypothetical protein
MNQPQDRPDRRFDGTRWWAHDGSEWVPVPDWAAPGDIAPASAEGIADSDEGTALQPVASDGAPDPDARNVLAGGVDSGEAAADAEGDDQLEVGLTAPAHAPRTERRTLLALAVIGLIAVSGIAWAVIATRAQPAGFDDPKVLAADIQRSGNQTAAQKGLTVTITDVSCIDAGAPHTFTCTAKLSDNTSFPLKVTVASDGSSYSTS